MEHVGAAVPLKNSIRSMAGSKFDTATGCPETCSVVSHNLLKRTICIGNDLILPNLYSTDVVDHLSISYKAADLS
jgi:hypothetical protein